MWNQLPCLSAQALPSFSFSQRISGNCYGSDSRCRRRSWTHLSRRRWESWRTRRRGPQNPERACRHQRHSYWHWRSRKAKEGNHGFSCSLNGSAVDFGPPKHCNRAGVLGLSQLLSASIAVASVVAPPPRTKLRLVPSLDFDLD